jgi:hypothetical protein
VPPIKSLIVVDVEDPLTDVTTFPGFIVIEYSVIVDPPDDPGTHDRVAVVNPMGTAATLVGAKGAVKCV